MKNVRRQHATHVDVLSRGSAGAACRARLRAQPAGKVRLLIARQRSPTVGHRLKLPRRVRRSDFWENNKLARSVGTRVTGDNIKTNQT